MQTDAHNMIADVCDNRSAVLLYITYPLRCCVFLIDVIF